MAGSQLNKLKSELKAQGLIGQTNTKNKKRPRDARDKKEERLGEIRSKFNIFDNKVNRVKRDVTTISKGKFVKVGSETANGTSKTNSFLEKNLNLAYEAQKRRKGKNGKVIDRRFGEGSELSQEDKMLQRFIREREGSKRSKFSLESDDEGDEADFQLTHSGKDLVDEFDEEESQPKYIDEDSVPNRKKTKKEVMAEVIAKSKFYKQQRQKLFSETQDQIDELDDEFQDVFGAITQPKQEFSTKSVDDISYDAKVRELVYDKRSVPADRTKTNEEIKSEFDARMSKLEQDRLSRMEGDLGEDGREAQADDLDFFEQETDEEDQQDEDQEHDDEVDIPIVELDTVENKLEYINKIIKSYKPHLREGNKVIMNKFVGSLFKFVLEYNGSQFNEILKVLKTLCESYNETLVSEIREHMLSIQERIIKQKLTKSDLVYFTLCGYLFSSSDKYHLIIIPNLILMNEILASFRDDKLVGQVLFVIDTVLQYQRISKRFVPEINYSIIRCLSSFKGQYKETEEPISIEEILGQITAKTENKLVNKTLDIIDKLIANNKDYSISKTVNESFIPVLKTINYKGKGIDNMISKLTKLSNNITLVPLTLQTHKQLAIKTYEPKFEENFNPTKIYDNLEQAEVNKIKKQIKKEKKMTVKDIRRQNKFESNQQINEKVKMYDEYHKKMANIVNSISTVEGKERNDYQREKKRERENKRP